MQVRPAQYTRCSDLGRKTNHPPLPSQRGGVGVWGPDAQRTHPAKTWMGCQDGSMLRYTRPGTPDDLGPVCLV